MAENFDPYYTWLGIPAKDQPPNYYRLLGVELFESNPDVIENAADRQIAHVRLFQSGAHGDISQKLLNEITSAKLCLLSPAKKAEYDQQLRAPSRAVRGSSKSRPTTTADSGLPFDEALDIVVDNRESALSPIVPVVVSETVSATSDSERRKKLILLVGAAAAVAVCAGGMLFVALRGGGQTQVATKQPGNTTTSAEKTPVKSPPDEGTTPVAKPLEIEAKKIPPAVTPKGPLDFTAGKAQVIDPDGDCTITEQGGNVTVVVPGAVHNLNPHSPGKLNAPRVLCDVDGDFVAQVKVSGDLNPGNNPVLPGWISFQSGGLLIWESEQNFVRLERNTWVGNDGRSYGLPPLFEHFKDGKNVAVGAPGTAGAFFKDHIIWLRLERRGDSLVASGSHDGKEWLPFQRLEVRLAAKVKVGVAALNTAKSKNVITFEEFRLARSPAAYLEGANLCDKLFQTYTATYGGNEAAIANCLERATMVYAWLNDRATESLLRTRLREISKKAPGG